ncbi:MAG: glycosyltransferase family 2 protein [Candidatus Levybacteria bacterium]|nr:glycosyltransferase family 2 protein [Candidatus Levybacteria bacterium]
MNAQEHINACLKSLLYQAYKEFEIIAIEDKSTDASYKILAKYKKRYPKLRVYRNIKRYGLAICLNRAIKRARGRYIAFMHVKDKSARSRLQKQVNFLVSHPKVVALGTQCRFINDDHKTLGKSAFPLTHETIGSIVIPGISAQFETFVIDRKRLPKDILSFKPIAYPFLYSEVFLKLGQYGKIANLPFVLYEHKRSELPSVRNAKFLFSHMKVWLNSALTNGNRPPLSSLFSPLLKQA